MFFLYISVSMLSLYFSGKETIEIIETSEGPASILWSVNGFLLRPMWVCAFVCVSSVGFILSVLCFALFKK